MAHPKFGMHYEDVRKRLKGWQGKDSAIASSLLGQVRLSSGEEAVKELSHEMFCRQESISSFSGSGNKQCGWGEGKKLGAGKWILKDGKWSRA